MVKNSCIFYLVNNNPIHLNRLYNSLDCLKENFLNNYPYPVVFGHEGLPQDIVDAIKAKAPAKHYFYNVKFKLPDYPQEILSQIPEKFKGHWDENAFFSMGYRHMCRFFAGDMYKHEFFSNVKYLLRLDCDSYITDRVGFDFFETMEKNNAVYGTKGARVNEMDYVLEGFEDHLKNYFGKNYKHNDIHTTYDTHFELVDMQWFKNKPYMDYYESIEKTGNIYIKRWGDAPIKYQGVNRLCDPTQICHFSFRYKHGGDL